AQSGGLAAGAAGPAAGPRAARGHHPDGGSARHRPGQGHEQWAWGDAAALSARSRGAVCASGLLGAVCADWQLALRGLYAVGGDETSAGIVTIVCSKRPWAEGGQAMRSMAQGWYHVALLVLLVLPLTQCAPGQVA